MARSISAALREIYFRSEQRGESGSNYVQREVRVLKYATPASKDEHSMPIQIYTQGDLDGLCGIYSVVNGLNHLFGIRPVPEFSNDMFETVALAIPRKSYPYVLWGGMDVELLTRIARRTAGNLKEAAGIDVKVTTPFARRRFKSRDQFLDAAAQAISARYSILIIFVNWAKKDGGGSHWTVLRHIAEDHIGLVDSGKQRRLPLLRLGIGHGAGTRIIPAHTVMLTLEAVEGEKFG